MNKYLLDTNICIHFLKGEYNLKEKIQEIGLDNCYVSENCHNLLDCPQLAN